MLASARSRREGYLDFSINSRALARLNSLTLSPEIIRASTSTRPSMSSVWISVNVRCTDILLDQQLVVRKRSNLRRVGDAKHLMPPGRLVQQLPDAPRGQAGNAGVDLIVDDRRQRVAVASALLNASIMRESSPPDAIFASGFGSSPGFVEIKNSTVSCPWEDSGPAYA